MGGNCIPSTLILCSPGFSNSAPRSVSSSSLCSSYVLAGRHPGARQSPSLQTQELLLCKTHTKWPAPPDTRHSLIWYFKWWWNERWEKEMKERALLQISPRLRSPGAGCWLEHCRAVFVPSQPWAMGTRWAVWVSSQGGHLEGGQSISVKLRSEEPSGKVLMESLKEVCPQVL